MKHIGISTLLWSTCTRRRAIRSGIIFSASSLAPAAQSNLDLIESYVNSALSPYNSGYYAGDKTLLGGEVVKGFAAIVKRADPDSIPAVFVVEPPADKQGQPKAQLALACSFSVSADGKDYAVVFVTRYLKDSISDGPLLALLAHEAGHFRQTREYRLAHPDDHDLRHFRFTKAMEVDADTWALGVPEVDPRDFKTMIESGDRLNNEASRKHPGLFKSALGTTAFIPYSVEAKLGMGWDHPTSASRIHAAEREIARRGL